MTELEVFYKNTKQYLNDVVMNLITNFQMKLNLFRSQTISYFVEISIGSHRELKIQIDRLKVLKKHDFQDLALQVKEHIKNLREVELKVDQIELDRGFKVKKQEFNRSEPEPETDQTYYCKLCHRSYSAQGNYRMHMKNQHNIKNILQCPQCKEGFQQCNQLATHLLRLHSVSLGVKKLYRCAYTNKIFSNVNELSTWVNSHNYFLFIGNSLDNQ